jgi:hypothetical protein
VGGLESRLPQITANPPGRIGEKITPPGEVNGDFTVKKYELSPAYPLSPLNAGACVVARKAHTPAGLM